MEICQGSVKENFKSTKINPFKTQLGQKDFLVFDQGFCEKYLNHQLEISLEDLNRNLINSQNTSCHNSSTAFNPDKIKNDKWKIRFYASNSFTTYFNSDVNFKSSRYNIEVKDYSWAERSSRDFFLPATLGKQGNTPFQFIDEPTEVKGIFFIEMNGNDIKIEKMKAKDGMEYLGNNIFKISWISGMNKNLLQHKIISSISPKIPFWKATSPKNQDSFDTFADAIHTEISMANGK